MILFIDAKRIENTSILRTWEESKNIHTKTGVPAFMVRNK